MELTRRGPGIYMTGCQVKSDVYDKDKRLGSVLISSTVNVAAVVSEMQTENKALSLTEGSKDVAPTAKDTLNQNNLIYQENPSRISDKCKSSDEHKLNRLVQPLDKSEDINYELYRQYFDCLQKQSPLKIYIERQFLTLYNSDQYIEVQTEKTLNAYISDMTICSPEFKASAEKVIRRGFKKMACKGCIPKKYTHMSLSPRIIRVTYGQTINFTKKAVRNACYEDLGNICAHLKNPRVILDLDLVSCYTSIMVGLYPQSLEALQAAIEGPGLWKYIQQKEFVSNGRGDDYNKTAVKVCVYSAYFGGGNKAMLKGILESNRKDLGLTEKQFRESSYFLECETLAIRVVVRYYIIQQ